MSDFGLTLNNIRAEIIGDAINDKNINDLQLAQITRFVFSSVYFEHFDQLLRKTVDYMKVYAYMKNISYSIITPQSKLN